MKSGHIPAYLFKALFYKLKFAQKKVVLSQGSEIGGIDSIFEGNNFIGEKATFHGRIGYGSYIGANSVIDGFIGRFCSISQNVKAVISRHPVNEFISTHPAFYSVQNSTRDSFLSGQKYEENTYADKDRGYHVKIGNDVWIGYGAMLMGGCKHWRRSNSSLRGGCYKGCSAVLRRRRCSSKSIRCRYDDETIHKLLRISWWD